MILDSLQNSDRYLSLNPRLKKAFEYIKSTDLASLDEGRHDIDGDEIFLFSAKLAGRKTADAQLEAHREYLDIQICVAGVDNLGWKALQDCKEVSKEYCAENDIEFFADDKDAYCAIRNGQFAIFFPEDAHAPVIADEDLHKIVVKVKV